MASRSMTFRLDEGLVVRVDVARGSVGRTAFLVAALESALGGTPVADRIPGPAREPRAVGGSRVQSSASAKAGVVPRWRDVG